MSNNAKGHERGITKHSGKIFGGQAFLPLKIECHQNRPKLAKERKKILAEGFDLSFC
jgi:hypothetical protein